MQYRWDEFELDDDARQLRTADGAIHVEPQVFDVLALLIRERHRVVAKEEILDSVWGDQFVSESALTTRIKEARRAVGDDGRAQRFIRNSHGHGYQFVGELIGGPASVGHGSGATEPLPAPRPVRLALEITVDDEFLFVGRDAELVSAAKAIAAGRSGAAQLYIGGPPGVGKSRFAVEVLERTANDGALACAGRCEERATSALQPLRDAVAQLAAAHPQRVADWCRGVEPVVASLIPSLAPLLGARGEAGGAPDRERGGAPTIDVYAGVDALLSVFERVGSDGPVVLLIDDLQWSDEPTRGFVSRLSRRLAHVPITVVATYRSTRDELPTEVDQWIRSQPGGPGTVRVDLAELDADAATALVSAVLGSDMDASALLASTAGHCLFLVESIRELQHGQVAAGSISELVAARLARQPADVQQLIKAGALLGPEFSFLLAAHAVALDPADALVAVAAAVDAELIHETASPERFRFSHQLVPAAIVAGLSRPARAPLHARCADALEESGADATEIASHLLGAVPLVSLDDAVARARAAARESASHNEFDRGIRVLRSILDIEIQTRTRAEVLIEIGLDIVKRGTCGAAIPYLEEAAELARRNGWPDILAEAALGHWGRSPYRNPLDRSTFALLTEAEAALGDEPSELLARVVAKRAAFSLFTTRLETRARIADEAVALAPDATGVIRMEMLEHVGVVNSCPAGLEVLDQIDPELDELRLAHQTYFADAAVPESRFLMRAMGPEFRRVAQVDEHRAREQPITEWRNAVLAGTLATWSGDFDRARDACDLGGAIGFPYWGESTFPLHALGHLFTDSTEGAFGRSAELLEPLADLGAGSILLPSLGWAKAAVGDVEKARAAIELLNPRSARWYGEHILGGNALVALGELALLLDDDRLASVAETSLRPFEGLMLGVPWACSFAAADTLSRLAARRGDESQAAADRRIALGVYTALDAPALIARVA